ncbi:MAG: hypothetical protein J1F35_06645 [Erysipelotrichales bacterium]|nr:hypothetical protein [Erysipelotrichales bacterium]
MTNKEFIKMLCISCGYHNEISIESFRDDYNDVLYEVYAKDDDGFEICVRDNNFLYTLTEIVQEIHNNANWKYENPDKKLDSESTEIIIPENNSNVGSAPWYLLHLPKDKLLDDKLRAKLKRNEDRRIEYINKCTELERPLYNELMEVPCKGECKFRTPVISLYDGRIIEDSVNYNCNHHFLNNCEIVKEHRDKFWKKLKELRESEEWIKMQKDYENRLEK